MTNETKPQIPKFEIPKEFSSEDDYLRHLTYKGAERNYKEITEEIRTRIDAELEAIQAKAFAGYFLMLQEIMQAVRQMNILVGPGRATAGNSIVNFCLGITEIDPLKYGLRFERFLKPYETTLPCFDFDLEEGGREKVLHWLTERYGKERVAQRGAFDTNGKLSTHACAVIIGTDNLEKFIPVWHNDEKMLLTSYKSAIEKGKVTYYPFREIGLIYLNVSDFKALSAVKKTLSNIKKAKGIEIDISKIPLDDAKTFEFFINCKDKNTEKCCDVLYPDTPNAHFVGSALLGYRMAYLKANFPEEFISFSNVK